MDLIVRSSIVAVLLTITVLGISSVITLFIGVNPLTPEIDVYDWATDNEPIEPYFFDMETDGWLNYNVSYKLQNMTKFQITYILNNSWMVRSAHISNSVLDEASQHGHFHSDQLDYHAFEINRSNAGELGKSLKMTINALQTYTERINIDFDDGDDDWDIIDHYRQDLMSLHGANTLIWFEFYGMDSVYVVLELFEFGVIIGSGKAYQEFGNDKRKPLDDNMMTKIVYGENYGWHGQLSRRRGDIYNFYYIEFSDVEESLKLPFINTLAQLFLENPSRD
jgi:hypothetical protein